MQHERIFTKSRLYWRMDSAPHYAMKKDESRTRSLQLCLPPFGGIVGWIARPPSALRVSKPLFEPLLNSARPGPSVALR